jgi:D-ribose pyranose/furanose isomerase RbsD
MATYLQGVTDYIPEFQPFQPDLNFYANAMQTKQNQYDTNYKAINNLYGELYDSDLTHDKNIQKKDQLLKNLDFELKRVSGLDLSLDQNVNQAKQVFKPFYEDKYLMKDMAWTKNWNNTLGSAQALQNNSDEKMSGQYWDTGIKELQYKKEEFRNSDLEKTLNIGTAQYTPYVNAAKVYRELAKEMNLSVDIEKPDASGMYMVRQKNGDLILPTLQKLFLAEYTSNPALQKVCKQK